MPEKELMSVDFGFWMSVITFSIGLIGGVYGGFKILRSMVRHDVKAMKETTDGVKTAMAKLEKKVEECEDDHVYTDVFNVVKDQMNAVHNHLLGNTAHDKRSDD